MAGINTNYTLLAIDSSSTYCSVALFKNNKIINYLEAVADKNKKHTKILLSMINKVIEQSNIDAVACSIGPGSFTGLRVSCGVVQGLAFGWDKPVIMVSSLHAIAQQSYLADNVHSLDVLLDARQNKYYHGKYELNMNTKIMELQGTENLIDNSTIDIDLKSYNFIIPNAMGVAHIAAYKYNISELNNPQDACPIYLREAI